MHRPQQITKLELMAEYKAVKTTFMKLTLLFGDQEETKYPELTNDAFLHCYKFASLWPLSYDPF